MTSVLCAVFIVFSSSFLYASRCGCVWYHLSSGVLFLDASALETVLLIIKFAVNYLLAEIFWTRTLCNLSGLVSVMCPDSLLSLRQRKVNWWFDRRWPCIWRGLAPVGLFWLSQIGFVMCPEPYSIPERHLIQTAINWQPGFLILN